MSFAWKWPRRGRTLPVLALLSLPAMAAEPQATSTEALKRLSVEELLSTEVTSVSRTEESLGSAAAAVTVVSDEDIRRSAATTVPEALRLVPGINVARRNANSWAVSSRGFSSVDSEKLLVLSDTRSIYTPLFAGVFWDVQDYVMEDIDRIEVIRGPGAALWGSNAVNGVINITTKSAKDTQGLFLEADAGTEERGTAARYGGSTDAGLSYRVFGKYSDHDSTLHANSSTSDDWRLAHGGFRADWEANQEDKVTVQGDLYRGDIGQLIPALAVGFLPPLGGDLQEHVSGGNVLARWQRKLGEASDLQLRAYYDRTHRDDPTYVDDLDTVDLDLQHRFALASRQEVVWGLNYRLTADRTEGKGFFAGALQPRSSDDTLVSAFVQDQISVSDKLRITLGTKLEHNDFSGYEAQPSVRAAWDVAPGKTLWAAVSRAVRVPTRIERDIFINASNPAANVVARLQGNEDFHSEELLAYELGYRWQVLETLSVDLAAFHNQYRGLASLERGTPFFEASSGRTIIPIINRNLTDGQAEGAEALAVFSPLRVWQLTGSYSYVSLSLEPHGLDLNRGALVEGATPRHQFGLKSFLDLPAGFELDALFRRLTAVRSSQDIVTGEGIPGYSELDVRLGWQGWRRLELSLVGQNLLHNHHIEFGSPDARGEIERSLYGKVVWRY